MSYVPWEHDAGTFLIYVDNCKGDVFSGRYCRPFSGESGSFGGLTELLLQIEQSLDMEDGPQSFQSIRSFFPFVSGATNELALPLQKGTVANFSLRILYRRNASWQGSVTWLEGKRTESFRSVLELLMLMSSAVTARRFSSGLKQEKRIEYAE